MSRRLQIILGCLIFCATMQSASAQDPHHPQINIVHRGIDALLADVDFLLQQTSPRERQQKANIQDQLDFLLLGVDPTKPMRFDILSGMTPPKFVVWGPYPKRAGGIGGFKGLLDDNLAANFVLEDKGGGLWEILPPDWGWFRDLPDEDYAILLFTDESSHQLLKQYILKSQDALGPVQHLLANDVNIGAQLKNPAQTEADQKKRRDNLAEIRANRLDALQQRPSESPTEFAIRKCLVDNEIDELERLMVEAAHAQTTVKVDRGNIAAKVLFSASPIGGSPFDESLKLVGKTPDRFASVKKAKGSVLSLRGNVPLDEMRLENLRALTDLSVADMKARLKTLEPTDTQDAAATELIEGIAELVHEGLNDANINGFVESTTSGNDFSTVAALTGTNLERLNDLLPKIKTANAENHFEADVAKVGEVRIHKVKLAADYFPLFDLLFGAEQTVFIGVSKDIVWFGVSDAALEPLKAQIAGLDAGGTDEEAAANPVVFHAEGRLLPWVSRTIRLINATPAPKGTTQLQLREERLRNLTIAEESLSEKDDVSLSVKVEDGAVSGELSVNTGMMKFVARMLALISKNNLE